jgi:hypothetical protein
VVVGGQAEAWGLVRAHAIAAGKELDALVAQVQHGQRKLAASQHRYFH